VHHHVARARIAGLRPTQLTVGFIEIAWKREEWATLSAPRRRVLLRDHVVPVVLGPDGGRYVVDHHHLCLALLQEGTATVLTQQLDDLSWLPRGAFWRTLEFRRWVHPYDPRGRRQPYTALPRSMLGLRDDPCRSLAAIARRNGAYSKVDVPFAEFEWAEFFRDRLGPVTRGKIPENLVRAATRLARSNAARYLPGWVGEG
jgi:hypothetical protein